MACTSSTTTQRTPRKCGRNPGVDSRMASDSGVVTRMWGGRVARRRRAAWLVSPVRLATRIGLGGRGSLSSAAGSAHPGMKAAQISASGR